MCCSLSAAFTHWSRWNGPVRWTEVWMALPSCCRITPRVVSHHLDSLGVNSAEVMLKLMPRVHLLLGHNTTQTLRVVRYLLNMELLLPNARVRKCQKTLKNIATHMLSLSPSVSFSIGLCFRQWANDEESVDGEFSTNLTRAICNFVWKIQS